MKIIESRPIMERYYGLLANTNNPRPLTETTVNRIINKHCSKGMATISANSTDVDNETNNNNTKNLIADIQSSGFSYIPVYGGYRGKDDVVDDFEPSFIVTSFDRNGNKQDIKKLFDFTIEMCGKYNQDSVLFKAPNTPPNYYDRDGNKMPDDIQYEGESYGIYLNPKPCTYGERFRRDSAWEILLYE